MMGWPARIISAWSGGGALLLLLALAFPVSAEAPLRGIALVIGNSAYEHLAPLANPAADARAIEALLGDLGFETTLVSDRDARRLARDLRDFVEDAEGADIAVLYYAGHGIEAGGENFLVPVDADMSALEAAGKRLIPISSLLTRLQATVPITILMLDACRDSPFPPGTLVRWEPGAEPVPVGEGGLGETRGARALQPHGTTPPESLGTVVAFAAEPGRVALDGPPGVHSPYTAAVLRHFGAMAGEEFGTVMRMVGEEVYLRTSGAQRPWVNESLRRLLFLGAAPEPVDGPEGDILAERRRLLVTIADLPDPERARIERLAAGEGVPLDALYAVLAALGHEVPVAPARLETLLREQAERLARMHGDPPPLAAGDAGIVRLAALAESAMAEGALAAAIGFQREAEARAAVLAREPLAPARAVELAAVHARGAEMHLLAFDHASAAEAFARAHDVVAGADPALAWRYRLGEAVSLTDLGRFRGDTDALLRAIETGRRALALAEALGDRKAIGETLNDIGTASWNLGLRRSDPALLEEAASLFRASTAERTRAEWPLEWSQAQNNLGTVLWTLGQREGGTARLHEAAAVLREALEERTVERLPLGWAQTTANLAGVLTALGQRENSVERVEAAVAAYRRVLQLRGREDAPLDWAATQNNLGAALRWIGEREDGAENLLLAADAFRAALLEWTRKRVPVDWAIAQNNLGGTLVNLGEREKGTQNLREAVAALGLALEELSRERAPFEWAQAHSNLGYAYALIGEREADSAMLEQAVSSYRLALQERTRERHPVAFAQTMHNLGRALVARGRLTGDRIILLDAVAAFEESRETYRAAGMRQFDDYFEELLSDARAALAAVPGRLDRDDVGPD